MGKQESPVDLPPVDWTEAEQAEWLGSLNDGWSAPRAGGRTFYSSSTHGLNYFQWLVCRERQLREALAQLRVANERAERVERERDEAGEILGKICVYGTLVAGERPVDPPQHAAVNAILAQIARAEAAEAKLAAPPVPPPSLVEDAADLIRQYEDKRAGRSKFFPDFLTVTQWLARYKEAK